MSVQARTASSDSDFAAKLLRPGDAAWDAARSAWNLLADQHPAAVVYAEHAEDVAAAVAFARRNGLRVAAQGTGHGAGCRAPMGDTLLVRTERMRGVQIDSATGVARLEAGVVWEDAALAAAPYGLAVPSGSAPDIGVVGYTTGGGFGWLARRHGLACNRVRAAEIVTADGNLRRIDGNTEPDLFWAIRGGGGSFGVITALEFELIELRQVFAGTVVYPAGAGSRELFARWLEWTRTVPDEITSIARFLNLPPIPQVPEPLRARPLMTIGACYAGDPRQGAELVAPMRSLAEPVMDIFGEMPPPGLLRIHMDPEEPVPGFVDTTCISGLNDDALDTFVELLGPDSGSPLLMAELRQAGGELASPAPGAGALSHLDTDFVFAGIGLPMAAEQSEAIGRHLDRACEALAPWSSGRRYFNFADRRDTAVEALFDAATLERLREVKARYDADDVIHGNHPIGCGPAEGRG